MSQVVVVEAGRVYEDGSAFPEGLLRDLAAQTPILEFQNNELSVLLTPLCVIRRLMAILPDGANVFVADHFLNFTPESFKIYIGIHLGDASSARVYSVPDEKWLDPDELIQEIWKDLKDNGLI